MTRLILAVVIALTAGCGVVGSDGSDPPRTPATPATPVPSSSGAPTTVPVSNGAVTKLLVFVIENHSLDQMRAQMPYALGLGQQYGYATEYVALTHPSLPNYLAITGGSLFGVSDNEPPSVQPISGQSVFGQALSVGKTAKLYAEGMPSNCATENGGEEYVVKHNPWAYYVDERSACLQYDVPLDELAADVSSGSLPNAGMVIPNLCNDAHDCGLARADDWLRREVGEVLAGPDWASGHLAVVITADEDDRNQDNLVLTIVAHPSLDGIVVDDPLDHYSLARLYSGVLGASPLNEAATAHSMAKAFGLDVAVP